MQLKMKKGQIATEILIFLILAVVISGTVLLLIKMDVISVNEENSDVQVLNTEFIPMGREGTLIIKEFHFCDYVDPGFNCVNEGQEFPQGSEVHFLFVTQSSTHQGQVILTENYRIKSPSGQIILDVDEKSNYNFDLTSKESTEDISFKDFFIITEGLETGTYFFELVVSNPLLDKRTVFTKEFVVNEGYSDGEDYDGSDEIE